MVLHIILNSIQDADDSEDFDFIDLEDLTSGGKFHQHHLAAQKATPAAAQNSGKINSKQEPMP